MFMSVTTTVTDSDIACGICGKDSDTLKTPISTCISYPIGAPIRPGVEETFQSIVKMATGCLLQLTPLETSLFRIGANGSFDIMC